MAFDFHGSTRPSTPSSNNTRKDIAYTSDFEPGTLAGGSSEFGRFGDRSSGFSNQGAGFRDTPREMPSRQSGFQNRPSSGFSNEPERSRFAGNTSLSPARNTPTRTAPRPPAKRPATQQRRSGGLPYIPPKIVLLVIGIIVLVTLCIIFREAITTFLVQVLTWVVIVLIIVLLIKLLFRRRRRW